ncbi:MAG: histidinol-phosphate transaminase [Hespellia sp.]|nr:histidinol-phosphate transaminase [Hespellia sp.]
MNTKQVFHGSDLERIAEIYHIEQESIINFGANVNPLGLSESVRQEVAAHLDIISSYPDRDYTSLRKTIGDYCQVLPEHVLIGNGSTELIALVIEQLSPKKALLLGPTYSEYSRELGFVCGTWDYYNLKEKDDFLLDVEELCETLDDAIDMLIICNPNNPTSSVITADDMRKILTVCQKLGIFVMIDETYVEFVPDLTLVTAMPLVSEFSNLIVLRGVSKFFAAPGLRLGYGVTSSKELLWQLKIHQNPWTLNSIGAFAGEAMLQDQKYIQKTRDLILSERTRILHELEPMTHLKAYPAYANFILVQITKDDSTSHDVFEHCIREGLMIRDCSSFDSLPGQFIRFCIMKPEDNNRLLQCLVKL